MKETIMTLIFFMPHIILASGTVVMGIRGIEGWGWFLFVLVLLLGSTRMSTT